MNTDFWSQDEIPEWGLFLYKTHFLEDDAATRTLGEEVGNSVKDGEIVGLVGELGAGKTTFMQGFVRAFSIPSEEVGSPTYSLVNEYRGSKTVYHLDLYRLENLEDLESVGYWDYFDLGGVICVEWINKLPRSWQKKGHLIAILHKEKGRELRWFRTALS